MSTFGYVVCAWRCDTREAVKTSRVKQQPRGIHRIVAAALFITRSAQTTVSKVFKQQSSREGAGSVHIVEHRHSELGTSPAIAFLLSI